jgi:hypothetical protein
MKFLIQLHAKIPSGLAVFVIQAISNLRDDEIRMLCLPCCTHLIQTLSDLLELLIVVGLDDEAMILQLLQINRMFYHLGIVLQNIVLFLTYGLITLAEQ